MTTRHLLAAASLLALAACGQREMLKPAAGHTLPQKPATSAVQPDVNVLLDPRPETRPERSDDVLIRSQERPDDRFDLPPPG